MEEILRGCCPIWFAKSITNTTWRSLTYIILIKDSFRHQPAIHQPKSPSIRDIFVYLNPLKLQKMFNYQRVIPLGVKPCHVNSVVSKGRQNITAMLIGPALYASGVTPPMCGRATKACANRHCEKKIFFLWLTKKKLHLPWCITAAIGSVYTRCTL